MDKNPDKKLLEAHSEALKAVLSGTGHTAALKSLEEAVAEWKSNEGEYE